ncbi:hypothetical protein [Streptomyces sp. S465]|uniref:hypothetical protein n=1 Tax=Streptomyces sp. S465 TaxID=2979468 RepID=UPI0022A894E1|nr:hypothetical protein [Streptomyces sp. S465]WAP53734.1 hypothetical protein N6H00_01520 [Streptomyces sp. S465]
MRSTDVPPAEPARFRSVLLTGSPVMPLRAAKEAAVCGIDRFRPPTLNSVRTHQLILPPA